ncbi:MAG: family 1 glycosylhydrolase, partial [Spirochaetaceae bacterium]|nr:family 1 glycosylhydrolase [Spirochaetaceae bacterium]
MTEFYSDRGWGGGIRDGDMELISGESVDFLGVNYYYPQVVRRSSRRELGFEARVPDGAPVTDMGWEISPQGLRVLLNRLHRDYDAPEIYITENGAAFSDSHIQNGTVCDVDRIDYLRAHLAEAWKAIQDGVNLRGYYLWSFMDNFEWGFGYSKRFGIVRVDYKTLRRTMKASAVWYRDVIARGGFNFEADL